MDAAGVGVIVVFAVVEKLGREPPAAEVVGDVLAFEVEVLICMLNKFQGLRLLETHETENHMRYECVSSRGIKGQSLLPVRIKEPKDEMFGRQLPVRGHNN